MELMYVSPDEITQMALQSSQTEIEAWVEEHILRIFQPGLCHLALEEYFWPPLQNRKSPEKLKLLALAVIKQAFLSGQCVFTTPGLDLYLQRFYTILEDNRPLKQDIIQTVEAMREQVFCHRNSFLIDTYRQITDRNRL